MKPSNRKLNIIRKLTGKDCMRTAIKKLTDQYGHWGEHAEYKRDEWQDEVFNGETNLGYWEWVIHKIEADQE